MTRRAKRGGKPVLDLHGLRCGQLEVVGRGEPPARGTNSASTYAWWLCRCACGNRESFGSQRLRRGALRHCSAPLHGGPRGGKGRG